LQILQGNPVNYSPLYALPILLASVLGSLRLALGTAAWVTVLLLGSSLPRLWESNADTTVSTLQAALISVGYFAVALLANQLSSRLASEGARVRASQAAAQLQRQVNELVIGSLPDGVLIVDRLGNVRAANPAARSMLAPQPHMPPPLHSLHDEAVWQPLLALTLRSLAQNAALQEDVSIHHPDQGPRRLRVSTRPTNPQALGGESLCVLFMQDQRELEARLRTEKLASMGRMSTAVAHEIRNPLAAISQANALLDEDLSDPRLKRLTKMVEQNTQRLARIVEDILNASRAQPGGDGANQDSVALHETVHRLCRDWAAQHGQGPRLQFQASDGAARVRFDTDHLSRVLFNLLDNAHRYASARPHSIQVQTQAPPDQAASLHVWSDGPPMDHTVERHLFEPFFSSESRSSGLGLYLCRELCETHQASIAYRRSQRTLDGAPTDGNEFFIRFARPEGPEPEAFDDSVYPLWPQTP